MKIEILGVGCTKCRNLTNNVGEAVRSLGIEAEIIKVEDLQKIMEFGVMVTPALAVDGEVKSVGKILSVEKIKKIIT